MQTDLKIKQTSGNVLLNCLLLSISVQLTVNTQRVVTCPTNPVTVNYTGCAIALQDIEVFITREENTLIVT